MSISIPEDELRQILTDIYERLATEDTGIGLGYFLDDTEYPGRLRQYAAKAALEGRQHESVYVRQYLNFDVNDPANKRYLTQRWYDLEERIKQLKEGM